MILSWASEEKAPTVAQLGDPLVATPNRRLFDFVRGEAVTVDRLEGGNPALAAETRRTWRLGFRFEPFDAHDLVLNLDASESRVDDLIIGFPRRAPRSRLRFLSASSAVLRAISYVSTAALSMLPKPSNGASTGVCAT